MTERERLLNEIKELGAINNRLKFLMEDIERRRDALAETIEEELSQERPSEGEETVTLHFDEEGMLKSPSTTEGERADQQLQQLVDAQANDSGLWFVANHASEAYLQAALRELHAAVESLALLAQPQEPAND